MFQNLFDSENQNIDFNIQTRKKKASELNYRFNYDSGKDSYLYKGDKTNYQFNRKKNSTNIINNSIFKNGKTIIKIVVYQDGFIVNNGEFKDLSLFENKRFLEEIERGNIPNELIKKGIMDIEILLEKRENEIYHSTSYQNYDKKTYTSNLFQNSNQFSYQDSDIYSYLLNNNSEQNNEIANPNYEITYTFGSHNHHKTRNKNNYDKYSSNTVRVDNKRNKTQKNIKRTNSQKKDKKDKNFIDFLEFKKEIDSKKGNKDEEIKDKKTFTPFSGFGQLISNINIDGLYVNKSANTSADLYSPVCHINIRLFNGEVIKASFNYGQTVGDIYVYVRNVSGSDNFVLLEGFPPKPITNYGSAIYELGLQNTVLTQKIN